MEWEDRLTEIDEQINEAMNAIEDDDGVSPSLVAVIREFLQKSQKALDTVDLGADAEELMEAVTELEQAGDSAKAAVVADQQVSEEARQAVLDAHDAICRLKSEFSGR